MSPFAIGLVIAAYLLGSVSSAIVVCRLLGLPVPRTQGSGNPGATNVLRVGGKKAAVVTLVGDMLKGLVAVLAARWFGLGPHVLALAGLAAFFGHLYPVFFGFKGGKGVATALGVLFGFSWLAGLTTAATWMLVAATLRISSLSALTAMALAPIYVWWLTGDRHWLVAASVIMTAVMFWRHRQNIANLLHGKESRIGDKR